MTIKQYKKGGNNLLQKMTDILDCISPLQVGDDSNMNNTKISNSSIVEEEVVKPVFNLNFNKVKKEPACFNKWKKKMYRHKINSYTIKSSRLGLDSTNKSIYIDLVMTQKEDLPIPTIYGTLKNMTDYIDKQYWFASVA